MWKRVRVAFLISALVGASATFLVWMKEPVGAAGFAGMLAAAALLVGMVGE